MSELKEFTASEMKGCPELWGYTRNMSNQSNTHINCSFVESREHPLEGTGILRIEVQYQNQFGQTCRDFCATVFVNPIDRMNSICKHLFELMPEANRITQTWNGDMLCTDLGDMSSFMILSIDVFLHTGRTEITREELGL